MFFIASHPCCSLFHAHLQSALGARDNGGGGGGGYLPMARIQLIPWEARPVYRRGSVVWFVAGEDTNQ